MLCRISKPPTHSDSAPLDCGKRPHRTPRSRFLAGPCRAFVTFVGVVVGVACARVSCSSSWPPGAHGLSGVHGVLALRSVVAPWSPSPCKWQSLRDLCIPVLACVSAVPRMRAVVNSFLLSGAERDLTASAWHWMCSSSNFILFKNAMLLKRVLPVDCRPVPAGVL